MRYSPNYNDSSDFIGAEFVTDSMFLYGIFECEATFANGVSSWPAFWSMHQLPCPNNEGPEIDFAEYFCKNPYDKKLGHYIHHWNAAPCGQSGGENPTNFSDDYSFSSSTNYFKCIWTPEKIEYYVDNILKATHTKNGTDWFPDRPVAVAVSQQITQWTTLPHQTVLPEYPQTSYFNFVKVKEFFLSPEITSPNLICTKGVSVMDIAPSADSITWSLSPTNLFSGSTTGNGKNASITAGTGTSGQGKITYTFKMPSNEIFIAEKTFWVGKPVINNISGPQNLPYGGNQVYSADVSGAEGATYQWSVSPSLPLTSYGDNVQISFPSTNGDYVITLVVTDCGTSDPYYYYVATGEYEINIIYPNPATDETTLSLASALPVNDLDNLQEWEYEIYTQNQFLKEKKTKLKGYTTKINTSGWKEGVYIVKVKYGKEVFQEKLIIER